MNWYVHSTHSTVCAFTSTVEVFSCMCVLSCVHDWDKVCLGAATRLSRTCCYLPRISSHGPLISHARSINRCIHSQPHTRIRTGYTKLCACETRVRCSGHPQCLFLAGSEGVGVCSLVSGKQCIDLCDSLYICRLCTLGMLHGCHRRLVDGSALVAEIQY